MYKDPVYYYFIVPLMLLVAQVIIAVLMWKVKQVIIRTVTRLEALFETADNDYRVVTRKEAEMRAHKNELERMVANHSTLTLQGEKHD